MITSAPFELTLPPDLELAVASRVESVTADRVGPRIWERDATVWGAADQPEVANRLGWLDSPTGMAPAVAELEALRDECVAEGLTDVVLLGMGGSSLAPEVLRRSWGTVPGALRLHVLDSTDPDAVLAVERATEPASTLHLVSTKSGGTIETLSLFRHFHARTAAAVGAGVAGRHFVAITDPGSSLADLAAQHDFRFTFLNDPDIGGRYSALSYFGLVPGALAGVPVGELLARARTAAVECRREQDNPGVWLGAVWGELAAHGRDKLTWVVSERVSGFGLWVEQLIAESTGKEGKGILPVVEEPLGAPEAYGPDRVFAYVRDSAGSAALDAGVAALAAAGHPVLTLGVDSLEDLGGLFFLTEFATAVAGRVLGINPFDQPNVQEAKDATAGVLGGYSQAGALPEVPAAEEGALRALTGRLGPPAYAAVMAYGPPSDAVDGAVAGLRVALRDGTHSATTFGYGPRFLHSTGQLHKGGPPTGVFLQLVSEVREDVDVPEAGYTFATLRNAQAIGDLEILRRHGLPAEQVRLSGDLATGIARLTDQIKGMLR